MVERSRSGGLRVRRGVPDAALPAAWGRTVRDDISSFTMPQPKPPPFSASPGRGTGRAPLLS